MLFFCLCGGGHAYNALRPEACAALSSELGFSNVAFMRLTAIGCYVGDCLTFFMVADTMLQDGSKWPARQIPHWRNFAALSANLSNKPDELFLPVAS